MFTLFLIIGAFVAGAYLSPAIVLKERTFYFDYSLGRGKRNRTKIYAFK